MGLVEVFQDAARNAGPGPGPPDLEQRLHEILDACRLAWPGLNVPEHAFVRYLAENLPEDGNLDKHLARVQCPDLHLACGCVARDPVALAAFDGRILGQTLPVLRRMGLTASQIDEVIQVLRAKLLVEDEHGQHGTCR